MARLDISYYQSSSKKITRNYRLVQVSDYHSNNKVKFIKEIKELNVDYILITGDLIDRRTYNLEVAEDLIRELSKITKILYICGNHEIWSNKYEEVKIMLKKYKVIILDNRNYIENELNFIGLVDPSTNFKDGSKVTYLDSQDDYLTKLANINSYNLLLAHRPEFFLEYAKHNLDLILCGHAHGGQFRFFNRGIYAPNQGLLAKYTAGEYYEKKSKMIVSRGLGNSRFPLRLFNNFELVVIDLIKG